VRIGRLAPIPDGGQRVIVIRRVSGLPRISLTLPLLLMSLCWQVCLSRNAAGADPSYLAELIHRSAEAHLADDRYWHLLLHYRPNFVSGVTSEVDDPRFFLAPTGKTDPQAELEATLKAFFSVKKVGRPRQPAQCAFIARYHWLKSVLSIDDQRLPPPPCKRFSRWFHTLNPASLTLVFPSAYMNNPASMFGHTLLRIDQRGQTEQTRLLAYTINYAAHTTSTNPIGYAIYGISGGFKGRFSTKPYYELVKEYGDFEHRDIWEYQLNLTEGQIGQLLMHLWELRENFFHYFFFKENCAYQLLSLLEIADPALHLTDAFIAWTIPADTVRLIVEQPGLVATITYRPARSTQIRRQQTALPINEQQTLAALVSNPTIVESPTFLAFTPEQQATLLDLASDYLQYQRAGQKKHTEAVDDKLHRLLITRSTLDAESQKITVTPFVTQPDLGHGSLRVGLGTGWRQSDWFEEFTIRAGYHDLLDPDPGYTPDAQVEAFAFSVRHYAKHDRVRLDRFTLANIISLSPLEPLFFAPSWKLNAGLETINWHGCHYCQNLNLNGGVGIAVRPSWCRRVLAFAFPELEANVSHAFADYYRIGGGAMVGALTHLSERWKVLTSASYLRYPLGTSSHEVRAFAGQSFVLRRNLALNFEWSYRQKENEAVLRLYAYF